MVIQTPILMSEMAKYFVHLVPFFFFTKNTKMRVLSLFSGIGGFEVGFDLANITYDVAGFSEIEPASIKVYQRHFPSHAPLGDVRDLDFQAIQYDMIVAGSPCTDISSAATLRNNKDERGLQGTKSNLFYDFVRAIDTRPTTDFILENVASMKTATRDKMTEVLQTASKKPVYMVCLNGAPWTGQARKRYFWTTWEVPPQSHVTPVNWQQHLLPTNEAKAFQHSEKAIAYMDRATKGGRTHWEYNHHHDTHFQAARTLTAALHKSTPINVLIDRRDAPPIIRQFAPLEVERLMGFPDQWTDAICKTKRLKSLGNAVMPQMVEYCMMHYPTRKTNDGGKKKSASQTKIKQWAPNHPPT